MSRILHSDSPPEPVVDPPRLRDGDSPLAHLLRQEGRRPVGRGVPFGELMVRRRARQFRSALVLAGAVGIPCGLAWITHQSADELAILPERTAASFAEQESLPQEPELAKKGAASSRSSESRSSESRPSESHSSEKNHVAMAEVSGIAEAASAPERPLRELLESEPSRNTPAKTELEKSSPNERGHLDARAAAASPQQDVREVSLSDCGELGRTARYRQALSCYDERAAGTGTSSEISLLEGARLAFRALGSREQALVRLDEYETRFSAGALRREAVLLRVEVLSSSGNADEARAAIEQAVELVPERATELRKKAFELAILARDCAAAQKAAASLVADGLSEELFEARLEECSQSADGHDHVTTIR